MSTQTDYLAAVRTPEALRVRLVTSIGIGPCHHSARRPPGQARPGSTILSGK